MPKKIVIQPKELWDEIEERFISIDKPITIVLEHSLVSISKWEAKWKKPYLTPNKKTDEELLDYIKCMTITQNVDDRVFHLLSDENIKEISSYIEDDMTATTFPDNKTAQQTYRREVITSEVVYYMMVANNLPVEFQKWHLNRLLTLLKVCSIKNTPPQKLNKRDLVSKYASMNAANKARFHTKG